MAQTRVNGAVLDNSQLMVGTLSHFIIDEVDGTDNISQFGYSGGAAQKGELVVLGISTNATVTAGEYRVV